MAERAIRSTAVTTDCRRAASGRSGSRVARTPSATAQNECDRVISTTAGEAAWTFVDEFIPIAGMDGYFLFVDARPGELNGCVTVFDKANSDDAGPQWLSISALLDDLATSLETGEPFDGGCRHAVVGGLLEWDI